MSKKILVSVVMGSQSDWKTLINCQLIFNKLSISYEKKIISAHRTPERLYKYAKNLSKNNIQVVIAGAGGAVAREIVAPLIALHLFKVAYTGPDNGLRALEGK